MNEKKNGEILSQGERWEEITESSSVALEDDHPALWRFSPLRHQAGGRSKRILLEEIRREVNRAIG